MKATAARWASYFFTLLFVYAAFSKLLDFENFQTQMAQSPLLSAYAGWASIGILALELMTVLLLVWDKTRRVGLYASFGLMTAFTLYIYLILNYAENIPCSCGGIFEKMSWDQHLLFNITGVLLALLGIVFIRKEDARGWIRSAVATVLTAVVSGGSIIALFFSSEYLMKRENAFIRRFPQHPVTEERTFDVKVNSYYFAGFDRNYLYLGNLTSPFRLRKINFQLNAERTMFIKPKMTVQFHQPPRLHVMNQHFFFYDGSAPVIYRGKTDAPEAELLMYKNAYFNQLVVLDSAHFAFRTIVPQSKHFAVGTLGFNSQQGMIIHKNFLPGKVSSLFETDGQLLTDPVNQDVVYLYSYQNRYTVGNRYLQKTQTYNTIVKAGLQHMKYRTMKNGDKRLETPPLKLSGTAAVYGNVLFTVSALMGRYEPRKAWKEANIVDMYSTAGQEYLGSIYLYHHGQGKITDMVITGDYLFVLRDALITRYRLNTAITKHFRTGEVENLKKE
ncbi:tellurium resistance protein TerC [Kaistella sp. 97-N-M2]|uniref:MauE/DoxX family redox-associated membrane protein n=1 Tax=Kaistella sp. 97-N-M2 TaxID=2908645 RepID=UPI001F3E8F46|nr:MauE/DoxX family redox-associated membrane protein [Kaistella sp. 97-N-M2]UJF28796.1 tellurium resistance protein TerC [Kaistella sp. 97-N-M2]